MNFEPYRPQIHMEWVGRIIKPVFTSDMKGIMAIREDGSVAGGVLLYNWSYSGVQMHYGAETPMVWRAGLHLEVFRYVYQVCDKVVLSGATPESNLRARKFQQRMGFKETGRIPNGYKEGEDYVIFSQQRSDCKYLEIL